MQKIIKYFLIPLLIFFTALIFYRNIYKKIPIESNDELYWISNTYFFDYFIKKDFSNPIWLTFSAYDQPKLAEYIYGLIIYPNYLEYKSDIKNRQYSYANFLADHNFYELGDKRSKQFINWQGFHGTTGEFIDKYGQNIKKTINLIFIARSINIFLLSLNLVTVYFIILIFFNFWSSVFVTILFAINDYIINTSLLAHSDGLFLLLFNLGLLLISLILLRKKGGFFLYCLLALIIGLLTETKLNGIVILFIFNALIIGIILKLILLKQSGPLDYIKYLILTNVMTLTVFILINPYLYPSFFKNTVFMYQHRLKETKKQIKDEPNSFLPDYKSRIKSIYYRFFNDFNFQKYHYVVPEYFKTINKLTTFILSPFFFIIGLWKTLFSSYKKRLFLTLFVLIQFLMGFYLRLNWERYYIQLTLFFISFSTFGLITLVNSTFFMVKKYGLNIYKH